MKLTSHESLRDFPSSYMSSELPGVHNLLYLQMDREVEFQVYRRAANFDNDINTIILNTFNYGIRFIPLKLQRL
jgi:hypothetical protein